MKVALLRIVEWTILFCLVFASDGTTAKKKCQVGKLRNEKGLCRHTSYLPSVDVRGNGGIRSSKRTKNAHMNPKLESGSFKSGSNNKPRKFASNDMRVNNDDKTIVPCNTIVDLDIVIDDTSTIKPAEFQKLLSFASELTTAFTSFESSRIGVEKYSNNVTRILRMDNNLSAEEIQDAILGIGYTGGQVSKTHLAIGGSALELWNRKRAGVPRKMLLFTDSISFSPEQTAEAAAKLPASGVTSYCVGLGDRPDRNELLTIAQGDESRVFQVIKWERLFEITANLTKTLCEG